MTQIAFENVQQLNFGSHFLGSGGGEEFSFTEHLFKSKTLENALPLASLDSLDDDALVAPMVFLGNGMILTEKNYNLAPYLKLFKAIEQAHSKKVDVISALSVGGGTLFSPAFAASHLGIPLLDGDCFGRTFPALSMMSSNLAGIPLRKAYMANSMGDVVTIESKGFLSLERHARQIAISSGGACLIVPQVLTGEEAKRGLIAGSLTKALTIGQIIQETRDLNAVMEYTGGTFVGIGGVALSTGFGLPATFKRRIILKNAEERRVWEIWMDNEFNLLFENGELVAEVPDIITLCDPETCEPLTLGQLYLHANVAICITKAPDIWYSEKGLELVRSKRHQEGKAFLCGPSSALRSIA